MRELVQLGAERGDRALQDYDPDDILRPAELGAKIRKSPHTLKAWRMKGIGPRWGRLGPRNVGYRVRHILEWLDGCERSSTFMEK
ncbi:MAG: hypothetical protein AAGD43_07640 [Pseudomonadota bacterium]